MRDDYTWEWDSIYSYLDSWVHIRIHLVCYGNDGSTPVFLESLYVGMLNVGGSFLSCVILWCALLCIWTSLLGMFAPFKVRFLVGFFFWKVQKWNVLTNFPSTHKVCLVWGKKKKVLKYTNQRNKQKIKVIIKWLNQSIVEESATKHELY